MSNFGLQMIGIGLLFFLVIEINALKINETNSTKNRRPFDPAIFRLSGTVTRQLAPAVMRKPKPPSLTALNTGTVRRKEFGTGKTRSPPTVRRMFEARNRSVSKAGVIPTHLLVDTQDKDVSDPRTIGLSVQGGAMALGLPAGFGGVAVEFVPNVPGFVAPKGLKNPYDLYRFRGGIGIGLTTAFQTALTGPKNVQYYGIDWPTDGIRAENNIRFSFLNHPVAEANLYNLHVKPKNSIGQWKFGDFQGLTVLGTGIKTGIAGEAGVNGVKLGHRVTFPFLGTNIFDSREGWGFDTAKFRFESGIRQQYGPFEFASYPFIMESPWLGQFIQRAAWHHALRRAGYDPVSKVHPPGIIPGIPIIG